MEINWEKHGMEFLKAHGWKESDEIEGFVYHPLFPMAEEISTKTLMLKFLNEFYYQSWKAYKSLIIYANCVEDVA